MFRMNIFQGCSNMIFGLFGMEGSGSWLDCQLANHGTVFGKKFRQVQLHSNTNDNLERNSVSFRVAQVSPVFSRYLHI
jgi:hypothetical protein